MSNYTTHGTPKQLAALKIKRRKLEAKIRSRRNDPRHGALAGLPEDPSARLMQLSRGLFAIVDADMFDGLNRYNWHARPSKETVYAERHHGDRVVRMHWYILFPDSLRPPMGQCGDHINGNGLDNRRKNLRVASASQNNFNQKLRKNNKAGFKGVHFYKERGHYRATIKANGVRIWLGSYSTPTQAYEAYKAASARLHGEYGRVA